MIALFKIATIVQQAKLNCTCTLCQSILLHLLPEMWVLVREVLKTAQQFRNLPCLMTKIHLSVFSCLA